MALQALSPSELAGTRTVFSSFMGQPGIGFKTVDQLLDIYWRQIDPTQADGQFTDIGPSYRAAIFYGNDEERKIADASKAKLAHSGKFDKPIVTEILPAVKFYPAEAYHQKYYQQNPEHFEAFEKGSGRVSFEKKTWGERR